MSHRLRLLPFAVALAVAAAGCAGSRASERETARADAARAPAPDAGQRTAAMHGEGAPCPLAVPGTRVAASDTEEGVALTFTNAQRPDEVRERARQAAAMHARMSAHHAGAAGSGEMHGGMHGMHGGTHGGMAGTGEGRRAGCCQGMGEGMAAMHAAQVRAEDTPEGARLVFTPRDPADLPALRGAVAQHARQLAEHGCPMAGSAGAAQDAAPAEPPSAADADHGAHHPGR